MVVVQDVLGLLELAFNFLLRDVRLLRRANGFNLRDLVVQEDLLSELGLFIAGHLRECFN